MGAVYIVDYRYYQDLCKAFGENRIFLPSVPCRDLAEPVCGHSDMALFSPEAATVVCAPQVFEAYKQLLKPYSIRVICGQTQLSGTYPQDVAYNVLLTDVCAFTGKQGADPEILSCLADVGRLCVPVAQGYARCSAVSLGHAVITADSSIATAAEQAGLDVLSIRPGHIRLPGYDYGFIGGACGVTETKTVLINGGLDTHPDGEAIHRFIQKQGYTVSDLPGRPLWDVGTIFRIDL